MKNFEELLQKELDKLPYTKHLDDGQYNDGKIAGFELGARWVLSLFVVGRSGQLPCGDCENYAEWDNGIRWCSVCGTKLS